MKAMVSIWKESGRKWTTVIGLLIIIVFNNEIAYSNQVPIITLSVGGIEPCSTAYIIQVFDDGLVRYKGVNKVKAYGYRETRIDQKTLNSLLKKFKDKKFINLENSLPLRGGWSSLPVEAIRMRQGSKVTTIGANFKYYRLIAELRSEIIRSVKADEWIYEKAETCHYSK
jgi:hypothetical protein